MTELEPLPPVLKGKSDWREYKSFRLPNGVTCMVVNDKESKTTAMSCAVAVGAAADPRNMSGLAHFCEHMCFLGSEKYPGENEYKKYLSSHGGRSNASTSLHLTTYKFDVLAPHAEHAVDVFSNFFIAPLFTLSGTSREVQAVDSENSKNLTSDGRRRLQILKALADPDHYYSKFTTGNALTLPAQSEEIERVRAALLAFHRFHYQPSNMTVTLVGPQSLDELESWIAPRYGSILPKELENPEGEVEKLIIEAAKDAPNYVYNQPIPLHKSAFSPSLQGDQWPVLLTVKPLSSMRKLTLNFPLPPVRHLFNRSPTSLLSHLLGHEGPGSSFALLQSAGFVTSLSAGSRISDPDQNLFQIDLSLTEQGEKEWKSVVALILEHCRVIAQTPDLQRHWAEMRRLSEIRFHNSSPGQAYDLAPGLAQCIVAYGTEYCRSAGVILDEEAPTNAQEFAALLKAENCILERCSSNAWQEMEDTQEFGSEIFGKKTERWYGIEYYVSSLSEYTSWNKMDATSLLDPEQLHLPEPNRYIPRTLDLVDDLPPEAKAGPRIAKEIDPPNLVVSNNIGRLWHRLDDRYALPKASMNFLIRNAAAEHKLKDGEWLYNTEASVHSTMVCAIFAQAMAQDTYDADLAGLQWSLSCSEAGLRLTCSGYSDRLADLAMKVLQDFMQGNFINESHVKSTKDRLRRSLESYFSSKRADSIGMHYQSLLLDAKRAEVSTSLTTVLNSTIDSCKEQHRRIVQNMEVEVDCFYTGNVTEKDAKAFFTEATNLLGIEKDAGLIKLTGADSRRLEVGKDIEIHFTSQNTEEENGAVVMQYQSQIPSYRGEPFSPADSLQSSASIRLICHMLREPLFNTLRTKQQLGYIVSSWHDIEFAFVNDVSTPIDLIGINVLSRKASPLDVTSRIDDFLLDFRKSLLNMPESEIRDHADALSAKMLKPAQNLQTEAVSHFAKIRRYGPEILRAGGTGTDLPWNSVHDLAGAISSLQRQDLVNTWDRVVLGPDHSRVTSMVYGSTFPLDEKLARKRETNNTKVIVNNTEELLKLREKLMPYENKIERRNPLLRLMPSSTPARVGLVVAAAGLGFAIHSSRRKR